MNRLPVISSAKVVLFSISKEVQCKVCNQTNYEQHLHTESKGEVFHRREREAGKAIVSKSMVFHCLCCCQEREIVFSLSIKMLGIRITAFSLQYGRTVNSLFLYLYNFLEQHRLSYIFLHSMEKNFCLFYILLQSCTELPSGDPQPYRA